MGMRVVKDNLWLCGDCMMYAVNGELPPDASEARDAKIRSGVNALGRHLVSNFSEGEGEHTFSRMPCDACGTSLGGDRYRFAILGEKKTRRRA